MRDIIPINKNKRLLRNLFRKHVASSALSMVGMQAGLIMNSILAGKIFGADGLAVMSVVSPLYSIYAAVGSLVAVGGSIIASHSLGRDDKKSANEIFTLSIAICIIFSVIFSIIVCIFERQFLYLFGVTDDIYEITETYTTILLIGGFNTALFYFPYNFLKLAGKLKILSASFLGMALINFIFNLIFCIGLKMGIEGLALGGILATFLVNIVGILSLIRGEDSFQFSSFGGFKHVAGLFRFGAPSIISKSLNVICSIVMNNLLVAAAGSLGLVIFSIVRTIETFANIVLSGTSQSTSAFVGMFFHERDNSSVRIVEHFAHKASCLQITLITIILWTFAEQICDIFGISDQSQREQIISAIHIFSLSLLPATICMILTNYYQSTNFVKLATLVSTCQKFICLLIPAYFLSNEIGINGIWYSFIVASIGTLAILGIILIFKRDKDRSRILLLDLKSERDGRFISFTVKSNLDSIVDSVKKIVEFCEQNQLDSKDVMLIQLSMEEMLVSIKDHCFDSDPDETIDIRILIDESTIILRIRNGGKTFNPIDYYERMKEIDPDEFAMSDALGISMISQAAEEIHYKSTLGINNLAVIINRKEK